MNFDITSLLLNRQNDYEKKTTEKTGWSNPEDGWFSPKGVTDTVKLQNAGKPLSEYNKGQTVFKFIMMPFKEGIYTADFDKIKMGSYSKSIQNTQKIIYNAYNFVTDNTVLLSSFPDLFVDVKSGKVVSKFDKINDIIKNSNLCKKSWKTSENSPERNAIKRIKPSVEKHSLGNVFVLNNPLNPEHNGTLVNTLFKSSIYNVIKAFIKKDLDNKLGRDSDDSLVSDVLIERLKKLSVRSLDNAEEISEIQKTLTDNMINIYNVDEPKVITFAYKYGKGVVSTEPYEVLSIDDLSSEHQAVYRNALNNVVSVGELYSHFHANLFHKKGKDGKTLSLEESIQRRIDGDFKFVFNNVKVDKNGTSLYDSILNEYNILVKRKYRTELDQGIIDLYETVSEFDGKNYTLLELISPNPVNIVKTVSPSLEDESVEEEAPSKPLSAPRTMAEELDDDVPF